MTIDWQGGSVYIDGDFMQTKFFKEQDVEVKKQGRPRRILLPDQDKIIAQRGIFRG